MRNIKICLALVFCIVFIASGSSCNTGNGGNDSEPPASNWLRVDSWEELEKMRSMIGCDDAAEMAAYLLNVRGGRYDHNRVGKDDLIYFISLADTIPYVELAEGELDYINYSCNFPGTSHVIEEFKIVTKVENGDSVYVSYMLSYKDVAGTIKRLKEEAADNNRLQSPLYMHDGRVVIHVEIIEESNSPLNDVIYWYAEIDGIYTHIAYYTPNARKVDTEALLSNLKITSLSPNQEQ